MLLNANDFNTTIMTQLSIHTISSIYMVCINEIYSASIKLRDINDKTQQFPSCEPIFPTFV